MSLESLVFSPNTVEPFEWTRQKNGGPEDVYFKSQNPYTYTKAKEYCSRQGGLKSTGVSGIHPSQLWRFNQTAGTEYKGWSTS